MLNLQKEVKVFCESQNLECSIEYRLLDLVSELGEVAKEILKATQYGKKSFVIDSGLVEEMGDLGFCLLSLANEASVDIEVATRASLEKYKKRIALKRHAGSC
jgi:NTP pyrophosphatase (non-canonical NTP hydrolase)